MYICSLSLIIKSLSGITKPKWVDDGYSSWCAVKIQSIWRMYGCKLKYLKSRIMMYQIAVLTIQNTWRYYIYCRRKPKLLKSRSNYSRSYINDISAAAYAIQFCWRSFCSKRIFRYFSELIRFKLQGAPADLLRSICPNESGIHMYVYIYINISLYVYKCMYTYIYIYIHMNLYIHIYVYICVFLCHGA
jgi:hypothetical protein